MRVTKTIKDYIESQLQKRREAIFSPYRQEANDTWQKFRKEADDILKECKESTKKKLDKLAADYCITDSDGAPVKAEHLEIRAYQFYNMCESRLPAMMLYKIKRDEVNTRFYKEKEELLISLELGDIDKKTLLAAIAGAKLEG